MNVHLPLRLDTLNLRQSNTMPIKAVIVEQLNLFKVTISTTTTLYPFRSFIPIVEKMILKIQGVTKSQK